MDSMAHSPLIEIQNLSTEYVSRTGLFGRKKRRIKAIDDITLVIHSGETLAVVGESGCGKTSLGFTLVQIVPASHGRILFGGQDLSSLDPGTLRKIRREMQIVFQNPFTSLNPRMNVKDLISEPLLTHSDLRRQALRDRVARLLEEVGMSAEHLFRMPHQLSGGQAQRIAIARALALNPSFLVLDEPTSALDVSVQAQVLNLLLDLQKRLGLTYMFITHDLSVVEHISDRVAVMYLGRVVELAACESIFARPAHPYTKALLSSTPTPDPSASRTRIPLQGTVPSLLNPPSGCPFHPRCIDATDLCFASPPGTHELRQGHTAACHLLKS
jgi:oligopeptide/dipeptide ABC transporter ATP-binding protein